MKMLWTAEHHDEWAQFLKRNFDYEVGGYYLTKNAGGVLKEDELIEKLKDKEIYLCGYDKVTREVLETCPDLKIILSVRDGPEENIDLDACTEMGIPVLFSAGRCANSVSELTLALMLNMSRPIIKTNNYIRKNKWTYWMRDIVGMPFELYGKTLSIVGLGRNGQLLAKSCAALGMNVIAYDPYVPKEVADQLGVKIVSLEDAMSQGDYISLLARVTPESKGMIGKKEIALMKDNAVLINTGRSALTDESAIVDALKEGKIRACLDVFDKEPLGEESPFYEIEEDRLILTPHIAGISADRIPHQYSNLFESYNLFLQGKVSRLRNPKVLESEKFAERGGVLFGNGTKVE